VAASNAYELKPWIDVATPHEDVRSGDLAMGTFAANLAAVALGGGREQASVYTDASQFFASTYFTEAMVGLIESTWKALAGNPVDRVVQLRTPFGGGKTHALLALYHLARSPEAAREVPELRAIEQVDDVRLAVLSGEYLDPQRGREIDGRTIKTLWGELAYQLGGWDAYDRLLVDGSEGTAPGGEILAELLEGSPALILLDEALIYLVKGRAIAMGGSDMARQSLVFIQNLTEAVNATRNAALVYSLQASVGEAIQEESMLRDLEHIAARIDTRREPVTGDEVLKVVQRRLFEGLGGEEVRQQVARAHAAHLQQELEAAAETEEDRREAIDAARDLERRINLSYPFHPELIDVMNLRWASLPDYQRTRGALQFLATVIHALWTRSSEVKIGALIGPGDVDLRDDRVRAVFLEQVGAERNYRAVVEADFLVTDVGTGKVDRHLGRESPSLSNLRVGTRVATAILLMSFGAREGEEQGAIEREIVEAALIPGIDGSLIRTALRDLRGEALLYLHHRGRRYRFEPRPNLNKLIVAEQDKLEPDEVTEQVRAAFERGLGSGVRQQAVIWPRKPEDVEDKVARFRVAYLHPEWERGGVDLAQFVTANQRRYKNAIGLAVPETNAFDRARGSARTSLAISRLIQSKSKHQFTAEQAEELEERKGLADRELRATVVDSYDRVLLPKSAGPEGVEFDEVSMATVLGAGRGLHDRVVDGLQNHVFSTLTASRLRAISKVDEHGSVRCEPLIDALYSYLGMPRLWEPQAPVSEAVSKGVAGGLFGYCIKVEGEGEAISVEDPELVRFSEEVRTDEIDLGPGAALLSPDLARRLRPSDEGDGSTDEGKDEGEEPGGEGEDGEVTPPDAERRRPRLSITATEDDLLTLQRALSGLRELCQQMRISLEVSAAADEAIDTVRFQNLVLQHLEEDPDVTFDIRWE
jgi:hypothetical protein